MADNPRDLLPGTLEMLILKSLSVQSMHGYGLATHIQQISDDLLRVEEGSLYPALQRLEKKAFVKSEWRVTPTNRRARYYTLTTLGRKQLAREVESFQRLVSGIERVLRFV